MKKKTDILSLSPEELRQSFELMGLDKYRAGQVWSWLYEKGAQSFDDMTNLSKELRSRLKTTFEIGHIGLERKQTSRDGTEKYLFRLTDGNMIESVLIPMGKRLTQCISTQVGCRFKCVFCASGMAGFVRNLTTGEILGQILFITFREEKKPANIVFMGIGEPLDNYDNVEKSIFIMNLPEGLNIGARKITISTCGIIPGIIQLEKVGIQIELSVSLHASDDELRTKLMPVNRKYPLRELIRVCNEYSINTKRIVTFEYLMLYGVNDSPGQASELAGLIGGSMSKVNLIMMNPVGSGELKPSEQKNVKLFADILNKHGVTATIRKSRGDDILAACGQLRLCETKHS